MAGFDDWRVWALAEPAHPGWSNAARQATVAACYEDAASGDSYRAALGRAQPKTVDDYHAVAADHCWRGEHPPADKLPGAVTRCVRLSSLARYLANAGWSSVDPSYPASAVPDTLVTLDSLVPDPISVHVARNDARSVFVTFDETPLEGTPAPVGSRPPKVLAWEQGRAGESPADAAVDSLALAPRPEVDAECAAWVVLHYAQSRCGTLRIPVPADGGLHERFRAVETGSPTPYGRTCGGWTPAPCDPSRSEPGLVHANVAMPAAVILVVNLGQTTVPRPVLPPSLQ